MNLLLFEVMLDGEQLTDDLSAYEHGRDILLPLGELSRLLTIGIKIDATRQVATGFVLREDRPFRLDTHQASVLLPDGTELYDVGLARWVDGDVYVSSRLLQRWLPIDLRLDMAGLRLEVRPRQKLPLQARNEREQQTTKLKIGQAAYRQDNGYPYVPAEYGLFSFPFIDSSFALELQKAGGKFRTDSAYSGFLTGDLLGMEAAAHLSVRRQDKTQARLTLARHDPDATLLGPLGARTVMLGNIGVPAVENVMRGAGSGNGILISNRPLSLPSSYRLQTLRGELPAGWDVTLYFNDALIGFQQARQDGLYEFVDQPLVFGRNEFKLVFNGPLGQTRVERQLFEVDESSIDAGSLSYTAAGQRGDDGSTRQTLQMDFGLLKNLAVTFGGSLVDTDVSTRSRFYTNAGVRLAAFGSLLNIEYVRHIGGGQLMELGLRTSLAGLAIDAAHVRMQGFESDFFTTGPLKSLDRARITGAVRFADRLILPVSLDIAREKHSSGREVLEVQQRLSVTAFGTSFTNMATLRAADGPDLLGGVLQMSRRVAGVGLSGQIAYALRPQSRLSSLAINADKAIGDTTRLSVGVFRSFSPAKTVATAGINRNFGSFGVGISGRFGGMNNFGAGLQLFTALGRNPATRGLVTDWRPMARSGMAAVHVFVDDNQNGRFDAGEDPVEGAGFRVNGGSGHPARTDAKGVALVSRLVPQAYADLVLDTGTLEDAMLQPARSGVRLLPRPGKVQQIDIPLVVTGEVDGTVRLVEGGQTRGIGNALIELLNEQNEVIASTRSSSDGFYVMSSVRPGRYRLRVSPKQRKELGLAVGVEPVVIMPSGADFISGIDFKLEKLP